MTDMGTQKLRYAQGPTKRHGTGRQDDQVAADDGETEVVLLAVYPTWGGWSGRRIALESGAGGIWWGGWVQRQRGHTYLAATCKGYGEGDKFWISGLMPKQEEEE